jgi:branched-chain amino acid transport system permease protein
MTVRRLGRLLRWWPAAALALALAYPWIWSELYYQLLGFNVLMFGTLATSWNILGGYTGYKSLGHSAFFGLGAYAVAIAAKDLGWDPFLSAPLLSLGVAGVALLLGWIMLRTSGSAFVIATIAMLLVFRILVLNLRDVTGGSPGISQPLPPFTGQFAIMPFFYYMLGCLVLAMSASAYIRRSRFGLGLLAIRDDEGKAEAVGVNTTMYKVLAFTVSAYFVALAGGIWSYRSIHISPVFAFDIIISVDMILMTMLGGLGSLWGPVLGAAILVPAAEVIRFEFGSSQIHVAILGAVMLVIILFLPRGIIPTIGDAIRARTRRSAYAGARSMEELSAERGDRADRSDLTPGGDRTEESAPAAASAKRSNP